MVLFKGIDVSEHNGVIDWGKAKADGVQFAMIRMGVGSDIMSQDDVQFEHNVQECERLGIPWGAYLYSYALNVQQARSEANHIKRLMKSKKPSYPVAFDMEDADHYKAKHGMPSNSTLVDICEIVLLEIQNAGFYAALYASTSWLDGRLKSSRLNRFDNWVAQWTDKCTYDGTFHMWQYKNNGSVNGIGSGVDMDYAYLDFPDLLKPKPKPSTKEEPEVSDGPFTDVSADRWSAKAIESLKEKGIFHGHTDGTFKPEDSFTREQAAVAIDNVLKYLGK